MLHRDTKQIPPASAPSSIPSSIPLSIPQVRLYSIQDGKYAGGIHHLDMQGEYTSLICRGDIHLLDMQGGYTSSRCSGKYMYISLICRGGNTPPEYAGLIS